jgi:hypothetical protein
MGKRDANLDRLLRSAASAPDDARAEPPFGFATRVVALWRAATTNDPRELTRFLRRVAILAIAVTLLTSVAAYRQTSENEEIGEPLINDYAIADSAIQTELLQ